MPKTETETVKHTPAPWHVAGHGNGNKELPILRKDGKEIGCIRGEARLADAALIAAAPTMLTALKLALSIIRRERCESMANYNKIERAILAAEGRDA